MSDEALLRAYRRLTQRSDTSNAIVTRTYVPVVGSTEAPHAGASADGEKSLVSSSRGEGDIAGRPSSAHGALAGVTGDTKTEDEDEEPERTRTSSLPRRPR